MNSNLYDFYIIIDRFHETKTTRVDHFSIRDHLNNLLSPSSTSRSIDYHSLQPGKFSIRVRFPHRQCFYPTSFHTGKLSLRQGLYSGKGSFLTGKISHRQASTPAIFLCRQAFHAGKPSHRQAFTPARFYPGKVFAPACCFMIVPLLSVNNSTWHLGANVCYSASFSRLSWITKFFGYGTTQFKVPAHL